MLSAREDPGSDPIAARETYTALVCDCLQSVADLAVDRARQYRTRLSYVREAKAILFCGCFCSTLLTSLDRSNVSVNMLS